MKFRRRRPRRGAIYDITGKNEDGIIISDGINQIPMPLKKTSKFSVYERKQIGLAKGDIIRITQNGFSLDKKRLNNGNSLSVRGFDTDGNIIANTGTQDILLGKNFRNFSYGYCSTSHSSQGKTVDKITISQSSMSLGAASKEQFYVSASRGRNGIAIYTDNLEELKRTVANTSQRINATDVFRNNLRQQQNLVSRLTEFNRAWYQRTVQTINKTIRK